MLQKQQPIYEPDQFAEFCQSAGAKNIFHHILTAVTSDRHSSTRKELNKRRTVSIVYKMCYCLSQLWNTIQVDHAMYLNSNNINQEGMDTEYQLGNTCSRKTTNIKLNKLSSNHHNNLESFFLKLLRMNGYLCSLLMTLQKFIPTGVHTINSYQIVSACVPLSSKHSNP